MTSGLLAAAAALALSVSDRPPTDGPMSGPLIEFAGMATNCSTPKGMCETDDPVPAGSVCTCEINGETVSGEAQE